MRLAGEPAEALANRGPAWTYFVGPDYFRILSTPLLEGRTFRTDDATGHPLVAVVNEQLVRSHGIGPNPIGRQLDDSPSGFITIVGVVRNVRIRGSETSPEPQLYLSYPLYLLPNVYILVKSSLSHTQLVARLKAAIHTSNPEQVVFNVMSMDQVFSHSIASPRCNLGISDFANSKIAKPASLPIHSSPTNHHPQIERSRRCAFFWR